MSDPHFISVILDGKPVFVHYGQSDCQLTPRDNPQKVLDFFNGKGNRVFMNITGVGSEAVRHYITNPQPFVMDHFKNQLRKCRILTEDEFDKVINKYGDEGWLTFDQVDKFILSEDGHLHRNVSAAILPFIYNSRRSVIPVIHSAMFDEHRQHIIDLDDKTFVIRDGLHESDIIFREQLSSLPDTF